MSQHAASGPARESNIPQGPTTLPRTEKIRESLRTTKTLRCDGAVCLDLRSTPFFRLSDHDALAMFGGAFGPELDNLKNAKASVEASTTATKGATSLGGRSPSRVLFEEDFSEVNRTLVGVLALKWIVNDEYDVFTAFQSKADRLSQASWNTLRGLFNRHLQTDGELYALLVATIVNDLGKDPALVDAICEKYQPSPNGSAPNHDEVMWIAAKGDDIELLSEFKVEPALHSDLLTGLALGATLNIGQLAQGENVPGSLRVVRDLKPSAHAFALKYLEILLDVAGAQGSADTRGSPVFTEPLFGTYQHARLAVDRLIAEPGISLRVAYDCVLQERAAVVRKAGFDPTTFASASGTGAGASRVTRSSKPLSLDPSEKAGHAFLRLLCISRSFTAAQAQRIATAFARLPSNTRKALVDGLSVDGDNDGAAILPYYAPALFNNTLRTVSDESKRISALAALMRLLARMYRGTRPTPGAPGRVIECDLSVAQAATKGATDDPIGSRFADDPDVLDKLEIPLDRYTEEL